MAKSTGFSSASGQGNPTITGLGSNSGKVPVTHPSKDLKETLQVPHVIAGTDGVMDGKDN